MEASETRPPEPAGGLLRGGGPGGCETGQGARAGGPQDAGGPTSPSPPAAQEGAGKPPSRLTFTESCSSSDCSYSSSPRKFQGDLVLWAAYSCQRQSESGQKETRSGKLARLSLMG